MVAYPHRTPCEPKTPVPRPLKALASIRHQCDQDLLSDLRSICSPSGARSTLAVLTEVGNIAICLIAAALYPLLLPLLAFHIGVRGRYLGNLMHGAAHGTLARNAKLNNTLGWLTASLVGLSLQDYKEEHLARHHAHLGSEGIDPKLETYRHVGLIVPGKTWTKRKLFVAVVIRGSIIAGSRRVADLFLPRRQLDTDRLVWTIRELRNIALLLILVACAFHWDLIAPLLAYGIGSQLIRPAINLITDVANHAALIPYQDDDVLKTRGFAGGRVTTYMFGGYADDLAHFAHHWFQGIPWHKELEAATMLRKRFPRSNEIPFCYGLIYSRHQSLPSVFDDIVRRLNPS